MKKSSKIRIVIFGVLAIMVGFFLAQLSEDLTYAGQYFTESDKELEHSKFYNVYKEAMPAVVNISAEKVVQMDNSMYDMFEEFFGKRFSPERKMQSMGSGFIINKKGYIVTNNHVVSQAEDIVVKLSDGKEMEGKIVGTDPETDIAVIKIEGDENLPIIKLGNSDKIKIGDWVLAIGNPFGLERTLTKGIVSAKGRDIQGITKFANFIQTDAAINRGNSGGPLLNINGEVIGINTAKAGGTAQNIGFAIPINMAKKVVTQLISKGKVDRAYLGIMGQSIDNQTQEALDLDVNYGVIVREVDKGSPADKGNLKVGDIILRVNNKKVENMNTLAREIGLSEPGAKVELTVLRDDKKIKLDITLAKSDSFVSKKQNDLGLELKNHKIGIKVVKILRNSPLRGYLEEGDIILAINRIKVENVEDFNKLIEKYKDSRVLYLTIERDGRRKLIAITR
ncbi:MAG: DegQ family serine endoprotease [Candidatus Mcinerneyibacterium aminivorans]|uniref:DegQ family serine endoprotease n=1 Tax=Candidatus Mcinerneyibacterium aminivorans TaxID=2703815 RepID=A0A5D0MBT8_9BACT|nr:MAG: DegQ family serine endoprotease [Candidatus Mcinerneyibacterium aminivorans]